MWQCYFTYLKELDVEGKKIYSLNYSTFFSSGASTEMIRNTQQQYKGPITEESTQKNILKDV